MSKKEIIWLVILIMISLIAVSSIVYAIDKYHCPKIAERFCSSCGVETDIESDYENCGHRRHSTNYSNYEDDNTEDFTVDNNTTTTTTSSSPKSGAILTTMGKVGTEFDALPLPSHAIDTFTEWIDRGFVQKAKNQMSCGGCWAFATCGCLGSSIKIATNGKWNPPWGLSEQFLVSCGSDKLGIKYCSGCEGAIPYYAFEALRENGVPIDRTDYSSPPRITYYQTKPDSYRSCSLTTPSTNTCPCDDVISTINNKQNAYGPDPNAKYRVVGEPISLVRHNDGPINKYQSLDLWPTIPPRVIQKNVMRMKKAIYYNGPITAGYQVTSDFNRFIPKPDNFYQYDGRSPAEYGHAVTIVGWKKVGNVPVWICQNSWGDSSWGYGFDQPLELNAATGKYEPMYKRGFWNHKMGVNDSFIESNASTAFPDLSNPEIQKVLPFRLPEDYHTKMTVRNIYEGFKASEIGTHVSQGVGSLSPSSGALIPDERAFDTSHASTTVLDNRPTSTETTKPMINIPPPIVPPAAMAIPDKSIVIGDKRYLPVDISKKYVMLDMATSHLNSGTLQGFFADPAAMFILAGSDTSTLNVLTSITPSTLLGFTEADFVTILNTIKKNIKGSVVVIGVKAGKTFYFARGDPTLWGVASAVNGGFVVGKTDSLPLAVQTLMEYTRITGAVRLLKPLGSVRGIAGFRCECIENNCGCKPTA